MRGRNGRTGQQRVTWQVGDEYQDRRGNSRRESAELSRSSGSRPWGRSMRCTCVRLQMLRVSAIWWLADRPALMQARSDAVKAVEDVAFWQARRKLPLPILPGRCGIKPAAGVADRTPVGVMEADCEASLEESGTLVGPDLEVAGRSGPDSFLREQGRVGIEPQRSGIGLIGPVGSARPGPRGRW
jgi:hypothetical protein